jgi:tRNA nucleotidyltransferase (CCA-adding enzyme)
MGIHLILTHEQADFDAVAALLAARLLEPHAHAILPHRLNRNVRAFLNLYGEDVPLEEVEALGKTPAEKVTLVDAQTLPSVRGVGPQTSVHIIDHHPLHRPLPEAWTSVMTDLGATTTLLVEALRERNGGLTVPAATLLLLGVYEDTGSLTYAGTTPRDVQAAAWLLEQGANLAVAADFLNHPLSREQHALYERLLEAAQMYEIQGLRIVVSTADAPSDVEEISTLAHKLRDLFDPEALFVLVDLHTHVQLVARSTTDQIDVAEVAAYFGGGGHSRAAAALVRGKAIADVAAELMRVLPGHVLPSMRVESIYSPGPQVLSPSTSIPEAAERMQRYGYEGFPVVRDGQVVGLLTRRAVDRALAHGMQRATVESIMESGSLSVRPEDSIPHLQRLMVEHGWGQVPVVSPDDGHVIGIVTRTDLLKALIPQPAAARHNLAEKMRQALPRPQMALVQAIAGVADEGHVPVYLVGGVVRDVLLELTASDLDLVVEGDAIALAQAAAARYGGRVRGHDRFGTAKWLLGERGTAMAAALNLSAEDAARLPESFDLVSARAEFYARPTALPEVERGSLKLDLHRRDFTINTLAVSLNAERFGVLYDYWGGLRDLDEKRIRVMHSLSFIDDPTRILRAVRLEQRLGFTLEHRTRELIDQALPLLGRVSGDRLRHELEAIFDEADPGKSLERLEGTGVLAGIDPGLRWTDDQARRVQAAVRRGMRAVGSLEPPSPGEIWLSAWMHSLSAEASERVMERLKLPQRRVETILAARQVLAAVATMPHETRASDIVKSLEPYSLPALSLACVVGEQDLAREHIARFVEHLRQVRPIADGETLRARGLPPGPAYRTILSELRAAWLDGEVRNEAEESAWLERRLAREHTGAAA